MWQYSMIPTLRVGDYIKDMPVYIILAMYETHYPERRKKRTLRCDSQQSCGIKLGNTMLIQDNL